jgi:hypothetical protein
MALTDLINLVANGKANASQPTQPTAQPTQQVAPTPVVQAPKTPKPKPEPKPQPQPIIETQPKQVLSNAFANYPFAQSFSRNLRKFELWFGNPSTGKTTYARRLAQELVDKKEIKDYAVINSHEDMTVMSILKTTKTDENGTWKFLLNRVFQMLTDELQEKYIIIIDEINTLAMSVLKAMQPIIDDTKGTFDFEDKTYSKNPNVYFIATMNHKDVGTSTLPDAIVSRAYPMFFKDLDTTELEKRTQVPATFIDTLKRIHQMFAHLGKLHPFFNDVRQLKNINGLNQEQFREFVIAHLELAQIQWQEAINLSPEFANLVSEFGKISWGK